jgi:hypothetical protein
MSAEQFNQLVRDQQLPPQLVDGLYRSVVGYDLFVEERMHIQVVKEGWLLKRSEKRLGWHWRYAILSTRALYLLKLEEDDLPYACISLAQAEVAVQPTGGKATPRVFAIVPHIVRGRRPSAVQMQQSFGSLGSVEVASAAAFARDDNAGTGAEEPSALAQVVAAASQPTVWLWGLLGGGLDAQSNVVFGLLGFSLLRDANGWPAARAALAMSLISVPVGLSNFGGSAICAWLRSTRARCALVIGGALVGFCGLVLLAFVNETPLVAWAALAMIAVSIGGEGTLWVMVAEGIADDRAGGAVGGMVNTLIVLVDALAQPLCAYIVGRGRAADEAAAGEEDAGPTLYQPEDFRAGFLPLGLLYVLVVGCAWAVRGARSGAPEPI